MDKGAQRITTWRNESAAANDQITDFVHAARSAWNELRLDESVFLGHVDTVASPRDVADLISLHGADLWLACACLRSVPGAVELLERRFLVRTEGAIAGVSPSTDFIDTVRQEVREHLLIGTHPRLRDFQGRGSLAGWLKTTSVRKAIVLARKRPQVNDEEVDFEAVGGATSGNRLEKDFIASKYRAAFDEALRDAMKQLSDRDRALLKLKFVEQQSIDRIGVLYGVHRATAARWVGAAREALHERLVALMQGRVGIPDSELSSVVRGLRSQVDVSLQSGAS